MFLAFEHIYSREFWRTVYPASRTPSNPLVRMPVGKYVSTRAEFLQLAPEWARSETMLGKLGFKTRCLVFGRSERSHSASHTASSWSSALPAGSFYQLDGNLLVPSPEFTFLQHASVADIRELIAYGDELCGYYAFDESSPRGFRTRTSPLTTKYKLASFLESAKGCRGVNRAQRALRYLVDGSASPMETAIEMRNSLPCKKLGGYGLPMPAMNQAISLGPTAKRIAGRATCYADICYSEAKLDIEYHGRFDHDNANAFDSDRARVNGLIEEGYEVIEITSQQYLNFKRYEAIAQHIGRRLGRPIRSENLGYLEERINLCNILLNWNRSGGTPSCASRNLHP